MFDFGKRNNASYPTLANARRRNHHDAFSSYSLGWMAMVLLLVCCFHQAQAEERDTEVAATSEEKQDRPNILFIMSDDHGYQAISAYGSKVNETPNLDRIAKQGMRFDRCFVTNSICGPSRAVILTGKYSHLNGFVRNGNRFNGEQQTVAKLLQQAGYNTAVVGKWHLGSDPTGFDYWHVLQGQGPYYNPVMLTPEGKVSHEGYTTDIITDLALEFLQEKRDPAKPFFLMYQHKAPHRNWQPGPKYLNKYDDVEIPEPDTLFDDYSGRGTPAHTQEMTVANHLSPHDLKLTDQRAKFTPAQQAAWDKAYAEKNQAFNEAQLTGKELIRWKYQRYAKDYLRCVDSVDENVGRVLDYLESSGLADNTLVIYTSDQGWYLGEHGWFDKRWMYEESFRTPLLVRWPGHIDPGRENSDFVMNLDFAETFLDVAGVEIPDDMQGRSLKPIFDGETPNDWRDSVYYHYYEFPGAHAVRRHYGVRTNRYKLIYFYEIDEWELYDLEQDPHELRSVYEEPEYAQVVAEMKTELKRLRDKYKDDDTVVDFGTEQASDVSTRQVLTFAEEAMAAEGTSLLQRNSNQVNPAYKPMLIGAWVKLDEPNGVLMAHGGMSMGYSLSFINRKPVFSIRSQGVVQEVTGEAIPVGTWFHLAASLDAHGHGQLWINGTPGSPAKKLGFVGGQPAEGLSIGTDEDSIVGNLESPSPLRGAIRDLRIYWGEPKKEVLQTWSRDDVTHVLFDGQSLKGWEIIDQYDFAKHGEVKMEGGSIQLGRGQPATGIRRQEKIPNMDYEIVLQAKRVEGSDFFCGMTFPVRDDFLTLIIGGWGGGVTGLSNLDGLSAIENETTGYVEVKDDHWYQIRLRVTQERIEAWLDHESILSVVTKNHKYSIWWEQEPARPFGIVTWNTAAAVRDIRVTSLER